MTTEFRKIVREYAQKHGLGFAINDALYAFADDIASYAYADGRADEAEVTHQRFDDLMEARYPEFKELYHGN